MNADNILALVAHLRVRAENPTFKQTKRANIMDLVTSWITPTEKCGCFIGEFSSSPLKEGHYSFLDFIGAESGVVPIGVLTCYWPPVWAGRYRAAKTISEELTVMADYAEAVARGATA
jgi:hypothetical protein